MPRRTVLLLVFHFLATLHVARLPAADRESLAGSRPNIVLIMPDDMGWGDIGAHGHPLIKTPHLDQLYQQSVRFTDFHVSPTCAPTRSALLTGRHEFKNGVTHTINERERMTLKATTLAQVLKSVGYTTGIFGKWHLGDEEPYQPTHRGFDEVFIHGAGGIGQTYIGSCGDAPNNKYFDPAIRHNGTFVKTKGYCTDLFFGQATKWIEAKRSEGAPFFAYITPNAPHGPLVSPGQQYDQLYIGREIDGKTLTEGDVAYYSMITNIDQNIGKLLSKLDEWEIASDTLVIFLSDNGGTHTRLYSAGIRGGKGTMYTGGTHAPSFWRWPKKLTGDTESAALAAHIDVLPTLAEIAGAKLDSDLQQQVEGRSLVGLLANPAAEWPDRTLITHVGRWEKGQAANAKHTKSSIRNTRFRLVENKELFDLQSDPGETIDVVEKHPEVVAKLRAEYDKWWAEVQPLLVNEDAVGPAVNPYKELYWKQFGGGPEDRPNILWFVVDDMSANFSCYGEKLIETPHVDRLAREGTKFARAFVTAPVCSPCRSALITGMYQTTIGAHHHRSGRGELKIHLPPEVTPVPVLFQQAGYYTCIGSGLPGVQRDGKKKARAEPLGKTDYNFEWAAAMYDSHDWSGRQPGQPFFMQVQLAGGKLRGGTTESCRRLAERAKAEFGAAVRPDDVTLPPYYPRDPVLLEDWAAYLDAVRFTDQHVGQVLARLEQEGILDQTLVIFMTDHGISHARGKQFLFDEGTHVPLVIRGPGISAGAVRGDLIEHIDLAAISLAAAGIPIPKTMQARNVLAANYQPREAVFAARDRCDETVEQLRSVRTNRWLYIRNGYPLRPHLQPNAYKDGKSIVQVLRQLHDDGKLNRLQDQLLFSPTRPAEELYDWSTDRHQVKNLAADPAHQAALAEMRGRLDRWIRDTGDLGQEPEPEARYDSDMAVYLGRGNPQVAKNIQQMKAWARDKK